MKAIKTFIVILSMILVVFPVNGKSIAKKYITTDNVLRVVYIATNMETIIKKEMNKKIMEAYSLICETVFGEP